MCVWSAETLVAGARMQLCVGVAVCLVGVVHMQSQCRAANFSNAAELQTAVQLFGISNFCLFTSGLGLLVVCCHAAWLVVWGMGVLARGRFSRPPVFVPQPLCALTCNAAAHFAQPTHAQHG